MDEATQRVQLTLAARGIDTGPIDGIMGPKTQAAIELADEGGVDLSPNARAGWLDGLDQVIAKDTRGQFRAPPRVVVIHYGAGTQESDVRVLTANDQIYISAHFSIGRSGEIIQMVPLDTVALHAGDGHMDIAYYGRTLNYTSIGIELENWGWLDKCNEHEAWREGMPVRIPRSQCLEATHPLRGGEFFWPIYPDVQKRALRDLMSDIIAYWPSIDFAVGHDEVSTAKYDPGPAFNMRRFRDHFFLQGA